AGAETRIARAHRAAPPVARRSLRIRDCHRADRAHQRRTGGHGWNPLSGSLSSRARWIRRHQVGNAPAGRSAQVLPAHRGRTGGAGPVDAGMERVCRRDGTASSPTTGEIMNADETYIDQVIAQLPPRDARLRDQVAMELRSHIAERVEHGQTVEDALRQFGDPIVLAESYLAAIPLIAAPFWPRAAARLIDFFGVLTIVAMPIIGIVVLTLWREQGFLIPIAIIITIVVVSILSAIYPVIAEYRYGKTVGKHLMGLRVVRESGARISFG